ncbi:MAG: VWA domain-containing protein [Pseudomonadota bacterium]
MSMGRRLPVYLLLDTSGSMSGEPIEAVRQCMKGLLSELRNDPHSIETAYLSVITFASSAQQVVPLTELIAFQEPNLNASGSTSLGDALNLLEKCMDREVAKSSTSQKGDWKPLVFLLTDGQPTDSWEAAADRIKKKRGCNFIACAAGHGADEFMLKRITEAVVKINNLNPGDLGAFFKWVSSSIKMTSQSVTQVAADGPISLPPAPPGIIIIP